MNHPLANGSMHVDSANAPTGEPRTASQNLADTRLLLSVEEAAARLSIGRTTLFGLIRDGHLRVVKVGRRTLVPVAALEEFVATLQTGEVA